MSLKEEKPMDYCEFTKCSSDPRRIMNDYERGCGMAWAGESCWSLYPHEEEDGSEHPKFIAYDIYLKETRLNMSKKMDNIPEELEIEGVKGRRFGTARYYSGVDEMHVLDVTYRFNLNELIKAGIAKEYQISRVIEDEKNE